MATDQLTATAGSGSQATTQSPQSAGQPSGNSALSGSVQPGTATSLLDSQDGVPLHGTALSTVSLTNTAPAVAVLPKASPPKHHVNSAFFGFSGLLLLVAVVLFWNTNRSAKGTL